MPDPLSAGILLWRPAPEPGRSDRPGSAGSPEGPEIEVLLVHPGGPYWARRDDGWWSVPKGAPEDGEEPLAAAEREFHEELGSPPPPGPRVDLGAVVQRGGKRVRVWAVAGDLDADRIESGTFSMEWPPRSGRTRSFPEVDRAAWFAPVEARRKILPAQIPFLDRLAGAPHQTGPPPASAGPEGSGPAANPT